MIFFSCVANSPPLACWFCGCENSLYSCCSALAFVQGEMEKGRRDQEEKENSLQVD